jgi:hypothetical protein
MTFKPNDIYGFRYINADSRRQWRGCVPESPFGGKTFDSDFIFSTFSDGRDVLNACFETAKTLNDIAGGIEYFFKYEIEHNSIYINFNLF